MVSGDVSGELCAGLSIGQFGRSSWYRTSRAKDQSALRLRIRDLAHAHPRFGYFRIWLLLRREGWPINRKRVHRLYRLDGLQLRMRGRRRKHIALHRGPAQVPVGPRERWSMDFVHDTLADGRPFRILTVVDNWSRVSLLEAGLCMSDATVSAALDRVLGDGPGCVPSPWITGRNSNPGRWKTGLSTHRKTRLHSAGETRGKCVHRIVQWTITRRVFERPPVRLAG